MPSVRRLIRRNLYILGTLCLVGCTTATTILKENQSDSINYAFSSQDIKTTKSCIESYWTTRDIYGLFSTTPGQLGGLTAIDMGSTKRLIYPSHIALLIVDLYQEGTSTVVREAHQADSGSLIQMIAKEAILKCTESQKFTSLEHVQVNRLTK